MKKKKAGLSLLFRMIPLVVHTTPRWLGILFATSLLTSVLMVSETVLLQIFFDEVATFAGGGTTFGMVLLLLLSVTVVKFLSDVLNGVFQYAGGEVNNRASRLLGQQIHQKVRRIPVISFEDTRCLEAIGKAEQGKDAGLNIVVTVMMLATAMIPYFIYMGVYLYFLKPILAVAILLIFLPITLSQLMRTRVFAKLADDSEPLRRECDYYESCMVSREALKETRHWGAYLFFFTRYQRTLKVLQRARYKTAMKTNTRELYMRLLAVVGYFIILWMLFTATFHGEVSIGSFAAVVSSLAMMYSLMEEIICRHLGQIAEQMGLIGYYLDFLNMEEWPGEIDVTCKGETKLSHVTFAYPNSTQLAIEDVSLTLHKGETLAIVGENGSGKTTLSKLILGLYLPNAGTVYRDGQDTRTVSRHSINTGASAVFQNYQKYALTLEDNVRIGDFSNTLNEAQLDQLCMEAGVSVNLSTYPNGYDTLLSREFGGVDLSGGQWQRVAVARGLYRDCDLIVLDEPTAAIDPYEEAKLYGRFADLTSGKTAVIVTHRLGSVKLADRVAVMKMGRLVQIGTHEELMSQEGEYARMYRAQEQWMRE